MEGTTVTLTPEGREGNTLESACPEGTVFNIQPFSIQDGPGIRTTIFFKGCPLHCPWCSNPESISSSPQVRISPEKCSGCGRCVEACTAGALSLDQGRVSLDHDKCARCLQCVSVCRQGGISRVGTVMSKEDALNLLMRDRIFFDHTKGGVTISGGEPLYRPDFLSSILQSLHAAGIHTALDTTGHAPWNVLEQVLGNVDLLLYDIKHMDSEKHRAAVGTGNELILENLKRCSGRTEIWLRAPLVPGFNDDSAFMDSFVELAFSVRAKRCYFLPLHRWGGHKYSSLGLQNPYAGYRQWEKGEIQGMQKRYGHREEFVYFEQA